MILDAFFHTASGYRAGRERTTVQLIDVYQEENGYTFSFEKLERWLELCERCHIRYLEFSVHLFTQWGSRTCVPPKRSWPPGRLSGQMGKRGLPRQIFGWDTDAASDEYRNFWKLSCRASWTSSAPISCRIAAISMFLTNRARSIFPHTCMPRSFWNHRSTAFLSWMPCLIMNSMNRAW